MERATPVRVGISMVVVGACTSVVASHGEAQNTPQPSVTATSRILPGWSRGSSTFHVASELRFDLGRIPVDATGFIGTAWQESRRTAGDAVFAWGLPTTVGLGLQTEFGGFRSLRGPDIRAHGLRGGARLLHHWTTGLLWVGGALTTSWDDHSTRSARELLGGGAMSFGASAVGLSVRSVDYEDDITLGRDTVYTILDLPFRSRRTEQIVFHRFYMDTELLASRTLGVLTLHLVGGVRMSGRLAGDPGAWIQFGGELPVLRNVALQIAMGQRSALPEQHIEPGRFATIGFKWSLGHEEGPDLNPTADGDGPRAELRNPTDGIDRELLIHNLSGDRVEIMGDITDWEPIALQPVAENSWRTVLRVLPGTYYMNLRVNGGEWKGLPGYPTARDGFGGLVSVIVIED